MASDANSPRKGLPGEDLPRESLGRESFNGEPEFPGAGNPRAWRPVVRAGLLVLLVFFAGFGAWAALAPLGSGAIAPGRIQVSSNQKTVQHLEGGIIEAINVRDGDLVREGDILLVLEDTQARVDHEVLRKQYLTQLATRARLESERDGHARISFPEEVLAAGDEAEIAGIISGQKRLFDKRIGTRDSELDLLRRRVQKTREEITALLEQERADARQHELILEEIADMQGLYDKGLARKPLLLELERTAVQLEGSIGNRKALIARAEQTIAEIEFQILNTRESFQAEVETGLRDAGERLIDVGSRLEAARDALARTRIRAPRDGRVHELRFFTVGGVIAPGERIMGIVPRGDQLVVRARIDPADIDVVEPGAPAMVRLTSFSQRTTQPIDGELITVSADIMEPEQGVAPPYYEATVALHSESLAGQPGLELVQGMPATVIISTGDQTLLEYLLAPLTRSFELGLREN